MAGLCASWGRMCCASCSGSCQTTVIPRILRVMAFHPSIANKVMLATVAVLALAVGGITFWMGERANRSEEPQSDKDTQVRVFDGEGFHEQARSCGIDFHMNFLPEEQGEKFKVNLYDHGCG